MHLTRASRLQSTRGVASPQMHVARAARRAERHPCICPCVSHVTSARRAVHVPLWLPREAAPYPNIGFIVRQLACPHRHLPTYLPTDRPTYLYTFISIYPSTYLPAHPPLCSPARQSNFSYGNATTDDLWGAWEDVSGKPIRRGPARRHANAHTHA
eukprot:6211034-Pleurochrysis_carterae.AAC.2